MSYQEYAQLGRNTKRNGRGRSDSVERPYTGSHTSFSMPRRSPPHSKASSTSTVSLSPSNSASQQNAVSPPTGWDGSQKSSAPARVRELDLLPEKPPNLIDVALPWRPFYLQRRILVSFIVIFVALIVALEALLDFSNRNSGLTTADQRSHYIWQYGPVLALTAIAALWNRVEFQAKAAAPWIRLSKGAADVERTLLLDYVSMFQPWTVVAALKNRDVTVAFATAISIIFKVLIILSTGLMALDVVRVPMRNMNVTLESAFVNNASGLSDAGSLALYTMVGLQQDNLSFPDGTSQQFAYQPFDMSSQFPEGTEVRTTVNGFYAGLECEEADLIFTGVQHHRGFDQLNTTFKSGDCAVTMPVTSLGGFYGPPGTTGNETIYFGRFGQGTCNNSTDFQDSRIVLVFGIVHIDLDSVPKEPFIDSVPVNGSIPRSTQLLCQPAYNISRVDVVKNGTSLLNISLADAPQNRTLSNVTPWSIAQAFFDSYKSQLQTEFRDSTVNYYLPQYFGVDAQMSLATGMMLKSTGSLPNVTTFFDPKKLYSLGNDFFTTYTALMAKRSLTEKNPTVVNGTAFHNEERLLVRSLTVHLVVGFLGSCVLLAITTCFMVPKTGFLPRDPNTIIDSAVLLAHSKPLLQALRGAGGGDLATIRDRLAGYRYFTGVEAYDHATNSGLGYFKIFGGDGSSDTAPEYVQQGGSWPYPLGLHPVQRVSAIAILLGMVAALEVTLRFSEANNGLGTVTDDQYRHLLWTSLPALIVSFVAVFFASIDFNTRALAPYAQMRNGASFKRSANVNLLDKTTPLVLFEAAVGRNLAVVGTTAAFLIASLLSIFTASVFSTIDVPVTETVQLLSQDFFASSPFMPANESSMGNFNTGQNSTVVPSLILNANMSFPAFTYQDMAFPSLSVAGVQDALNPSADLTFTATIPATRARMECQIIPDDLINVNLTVNATVDFGGVINPLKVSITGAPANASISISTARGSNGVDPKSPIKTFIDPNAFFGAADYQPFKNASSSDNQTAHYVYIWGRLSNADTNSTTLESVSALTCNEVLRDIDVEVTFLGSSLIIDETRPPKPIESTDRPSTVAMEEAWNYNNMVNVSTPHLLDQFFTSLVQSRFAIPLASLGLDDNETRSAVADAIAAQHGIIRAQMTSTSLRRPTTNSTAEEDVFPQTVGDGGPLGNATQIAYPATLTSSGVGARRRVVQDLVTTRILQGLLAAMVFFTVLGWAAFPRPNILPRPPTSIASVAALLADGNVFGFLGRGAEWQSAEEVQAVFKDGLHVTAGFKLGWDKVRKRRREETLATWGLNGSVQKEEVFSISAMRTGGWGGGENVGLGLQARVGYGQRRYVRDWGWRQ